MSATLYRSPGGRVYHLLVPGEDATYCGRIIPRVPGPGGRLSGAPSSTPSDPGWRTVCRTCQTIQSK